MPLGLTSDLNLGQNEDNLAVHDKIIDGSGDLTGEIKIEKKMKQENIAYEKQDIDSQSGIIKNSARVDSEEADTKERTNDDDGKENSQNSQKNIKGPVKLL